MVSLAQCNDLLLLARKNLWPLYRTPRILACSFRWSVRERFARSNKFTDAYVMRINCCTLRRSHHHQAGKRDRRPSSPRIDSRKSHNSNDNDRESPHYGLNFASRSGCRRCHHGCHCLSCLLLVLFVVAAGSSGIGELLCASRAFSTRLPVVVGDGGSFDSFGWERAASQLPTGNKEMLGTQKINGCGRRGVSQRWSWDSLNPSGISGSFFSNKLFARRIKSYVLNGVADRSAGRSTFYLLYIRVDVLFLSRWQLFPLHKIGEWGQANERANSLVSVSTGICRCLHFCVTKCADNVTRRAGMKMKGKLG